MRVVCTVSGDRRIAGRLLTMIAAVASDLARDRLDSTVVKERALSSTVFMEIRETNKSRGEQLGRVLERLEWRVQLLIPYCSLIVVGV